MGLPPNWHFTMRCLQSIYGVIDSIRGKDPVVVFGQHRQIGRRHSEVLADGAVALSIRAMAACARRLKL
jgi:hypothetical protein